MQHTRRESGLVPSVAREDDVDFGRLLIEDVASDRVDALAIRFGVQDRGSSCERIDVCPQRRPRRPP